jgi:hypothetical protein
MDSLDLAEFEAEQSAAPTQKSKLEAAADAALIGLEWKSKPLSPWKQPHMLAADACGLKALKTASFLEAMEDMDLAQREGREFDESKLLYPGIVYDAALCTWLRLVNRSAVLRAARDSTWGAEQVFKFAEAESIVMNSPAFSDALGILAHSIAETILVIGKFSRADGEESSSPAASGND